MSHATLPATPMLTGVVAHAKRKNLWSNSLGIGANIESGRARLKFFRKRYF